MTVPGRWSDNSHELMAVRGTADPLNVERSPLTRRREEKREALLTSLILAHTCAGLVIQKTGSHRRFLAINGSPAGVYDGQSSAVRRSTSSDLTVEVWVIHFHRSRQIRQNPFCWNLQTVGNTSTTAHDDADVLVR